MRAIIEVDVPNYQIGQEVSIYFKDTMMIKGIVQEPKTGHWVSNAIQGEIDGQIIKAFTCSECGAISVFRMADGKIVNGDLCPNCGARMESEKV